MPTPAEPEAPLAPGMLASHYAPRTKLRLNAISIEPGEALLAWLVAARIVVLNGWLLFETAMGW